MKMKKGFFMIMMFGIWTILLQIVDVQKAGESMTKIGFATFNGWFHKVTGVHMWIYTVTDWLGLVAVFICMIFGVIGSVQLLKRKSLLKVDKDILILGVYYLLVISGYLLFEMIPINYRPILIEGRMEASYPSSTTLLVLSVMPTLIFQCKRRIQNIKLRKICCRIAMLFTVFMVVGRLISGVHWFTDIVGSVLLCVGLFELYKGHVMLYCKENRN